MGFCKITKECNVLYAVLVYSCRACGGLSPQVMKVFEVKIVGPRIADNRGSRYGNSFVSCTARKSQCTNIL